MAEGDTAVIDFEGFDNGVAFEGGKGEDYSLKIGSGSFIPGFEDQVVGMSAGEEKEINVTFPEDYGAAELAGKPVVFKVKVKEVKSHPIPLSWMTSLPKMYPRQPTAPGRASEGTGGRNWQKEKADSADAAFKNAVMQKAIDNMTAVIPDAMVEEPLDDVSAAVSGHEHAAERLQAWSSMLR